MDMMRRVSSGSSRYAATAPGPAAWRSAPRSVQKHRTVRNTSRPGARCVRTVPSRCSTATTLLVVPKSMPTTGGPVTGKLADMGRG